MGQWLSNDIWNRMGEWWMQRGMELDSGHAKRYGMGQWPCKRGRVVMQRGMEQDSGKWRTHSGEMHTPCTRTEATTECTVFLGRKA